MDPALDRRSAAEPESLLCGWGHPESVGKRRQWTGEARVKHKTKTPEQMLPGREPSRAGPWGWVRTSLRACNPNSPAWVANLRPGIQKMCSSCIVHYLLVLTCTVVLYCSMQCAVVPAVLQTARTTLRALAINLCMCMWCLNEPPWTRAGLCGGMPASLRPTPILVDVHSWH